MRRRCHNSWHIWFDSNPMIRQAAAGALAKMGPAARAAKPALLRCLQRSVRHLCGPMPPAALGWLGKDPELIPPLIGALDDQDEEVRRYAAYCAEHDRPDFRTSRPQTHRAAGRLSHGVHGRLEHSAQWHTRPAVDPATDQGTPAQ